MPATRHEHSVPGASTLSSTRPTLGPLEAKVLDHLWERREPLPVREVKSAFPALAYTTIMTTLDRLYRKGLLSRRRRGRAFCYEPRRSRAELSRELVSGQLAALLTESGASTAILSTLVQTVGSQSAALLTELEALVRAERARLRFEEGE
jgi:predicted transcriptional regulator